MCLNRDYEIYDRTNNIWVSVCDKIIRPTAQLIYYI